MPYKSGRLAFYSLCPLVPADDFLDLKHVPPRFARNNRRQPDSLFASSASKNPFFILCFVCLHLAAASRGRSVFVGVVVAAGNVLVRKPKRGDFNYSDCDNNCNAAHLLGKNGSNETKE